MNLGTLRERVGAVGVVACALAGCAGAGEGTVAGTITVPACNLSGAYDLHASFFGADRYGNSLSIRIQNGGGDVDYTDNLVVTIDDASVIARALEISTDRDADGHAIVTVPVGLGAGDGSNVHAILTPTHSCGRLKVTLFGQTVGLPARSGTITFRAIDRGEGSSATTVQSDPRLTDVASFHFALSDPRPFGLPAPAGVDPDAPVGSADLSGSFRFDYTRRVPAQLFP